MKAMKLGEDFIIEVRKWYEENDKDFPEHWQTKDPEWWVEYRKRHEGKS